MLDELHTEVIETVDFIIFDNILENSISLIMCFIATIKVGLSAFNLRNELIKLSLEGLGG